MKKIIFLAFISIFLSACGGGSGTSKSSQGFAPIDNAAFNKKFVGHSLKKNNKSKTGDLIKKENKFEVKQDDGSLAIGNYTYTYTNTGKNKFTMIIEYRSESVSGSCTLDFTFKTPLSGEFKVKVCTGQEKSGKIYSKLGEDMDINDSTGTFTFDGSN